MPTSSRKRGSRFSRHPDKGRLLSMSSEEQEGHSVTDSVKHGNNSTIVPSDRDFGPNGYDPNARARFAINHATASLDLSQEGNSGDEAGGADLDGNSRVNNTNVVYQDDYRVNVDDRVYTDDFDGYFLNSQRPRVIGDYCSTGNHVDKYNPNHSNHSADNYKRNGGNNDSAAIVTNGAEHGKHAERMSQKISDNKVNEEYTHSSTTKTQVPVGNHVGHKDKNRNATGDFKSKIMDNLLTDVLSVSENSKHATVNVTHSPSSNDNNSANELQILSEISSEQLNGISSNKVKAANEKEEQNQTAPTTEESIELKPQNESKSKNSSASNSMPSISSRSHCSQNSKPRTKVIYYQNRFMTVPIDRNTCASPSNNNNSKRHSSVKNAPKSPASRMRDESQKADDNNIATTSGTVAADNCSSDISISANKSSVVFTNVTNSDRNGVIPNMNPIELDTTISMQSDGGDSKDEKRSKSSRLSRLTVENSILKKVASVLRDNRMRGDDGEVASKLRTMNKSQATSSPILKRALNIIFVTTGVALLLAVIIVILYTSIAGTNSSESSDSGKQPDKHKETQVNIIQMDEIDDFNNNTLPTKPTSYDVNHLENGDTHNKDSRRRVRDDSFISIAMPKFNGTFRPRGRGHGG